MVTSLASVTSCGWQSFPKFYREEKVLYAQVGLNGKTRLLAEKTEYQKLKGKSKRSWEISHFLELKAEEMGKVLVMSSGGWIRSISQTSHFKYVAYIFNLLLSPLNGKMLWRNSKTWNEYMPKKKIWTWWLIPFKWFSLQTAQIVEIAR